MLKIRIQEPALKRISVRLFLAASVLATVVATPSAIAQSASDAPECADIQGQLTQGGLFWLQLEPGETASLDGEPLATLKDGVSFGAFGRDAAAKAKLSVKGARDCQQPLKIAKRDYRIQRVEGVPARTVTPPKEQLERIQREARLVAKARQQQLQPGTFNGQYLNSFQWPVTGPISGVYGSQRVYNGKPGRPHYGLDIAVPTGSEVVAPAAGVVTLAEPDLFYSGGTVILDHGYQLSSTFLHMSKVLVKPGDEIAAGDIIGLVGSTGRATGPHLDWRMNWRDRRIDPQLLLPVMQK